MAARVLVVSPRGRFVEEISRLLALQQNKYESEAMWQFPPPAELDRLLAPGSEIAAFLVDWSDSDAASRLLRRVRLKRPDIPCFALAEERDAQKEREASRGGAAATLTPPYDFESLPRRTEAASHAAVPGRLICFAPAHGGGGASTIALHVASTLAHLCANERRPTLFVEFDLHSASAAFRLKLGKAVTVVDALKALRAGEDPWTDLAAPRPGLRMLPAPPAESSFDPNALTDPIGLLESARRSFSWIVVDLPSALFASCRDALSVAEAAYVVASPEAAARTLARRRFEDLNTLGFRGHDIRLVLNRVDPNAQGNLAAEWALEGAELAAVIPNAWSEVNDAYILGRLVADETPFGRAIEDLVKQIMGS